jgi:hypothetical protein
MPVAAQGRIYATPIAYYMPRSTLMTGNTVLGLAQSPYAHR